MRRLLTLMVAASSVLGSFAQGVLNFANKTNGVDARIFWVDCQTVLYGWVAGLFYGPAGVPECLRVTHTFTDVHYGYFNAGAIVIDGFRPGQTITAQVRVWDLNISPYWDQAVRAVGPTNMIGVSPLFQVTLAAPTEPPANLTGLKPFCLRWPEGIHPHPSLSVQVVLTNTLVFSWGANSLLGPAADNFLLQQNSSLGSTNWVTLTNVPWTDWFQKQVPLPRPATAMFYRLISQQ